MDYDNDGDDDIFLANHGTANRLLINEGASGFIDIPPQNLAEVDGIVDASWADGDNDGDQDVLLARSSGNHLVSRKSGRIAGGHLFVLR